MLKTNLSGHNKIWEHTKKFRDTASECPNGYRPSIVAIGKSERQVRKASHCGSKQQQRSHAMSTFCAH